MDNDEDIRQALSALSARTIALEAAISALADQCADRKRALASFDDFGREMLDRFTGLPVDEHYLDLIRESFNDMRVVFQNTE